MEITFQFEKQQPRKGRPVRPASHTDAAPRIPRISRLMALAIRIRANMSLYCSFILSTSKDGPSRVGWKRISIRTVFIQDLVLGEQMSWRCLYTHALCSSTRTSAIFRKP